MHIGIGAHVDALHVILFIGEFVSLLADRVCLGLRLG